MIDKGLNNILELLIIPIIIFYVLILIAEKLDKFCEFSFMLNEKFYIPIDIFKSKLMEIVLLSFVLIFFTISFINVFNVDVETILQHKVYNEFNLKDLLKISIIAFTLYNYKDGYSKYKKLILKNKEYDLYDEKPEKYILYLKNKEENYNILYELEKEKLNIYKSLSPSALMPTILGIILSGNEIQIEWGIYSFICFSVLIIYFYLTWNCFKKMRIHKLNYFKTKKEIKHKKNRQNVG